MAGQSILTYLPDEDRAALLLEIAKTIAGKDGGRIIGAYVGSDYTVIPDMGYPMPADFYEVHVEREAECAERIRQVYERTMRDEPFGSEWRNIPCGAETVAERLLPLARSCDLIVADMFKHSNADARFTEVPETLTLGAGRPVMLVPEDTKPDLSLDEIMVAWDGSRESARAVFDALPLLRKAAQVHIVSVEEYADDETLLDVPAAEIAATLAGHGVQCEARRVTQKTMRTRENVGQALMRTASEVGADMLVMGMYGHSRLREVIFGGASRHMLRHSKIPVFASH